MAAQSGSRACWGFRMQVFPGADELLNFEKITDGYQIEKRGGKLFSAAKK